MGRKPKSADSASRGMVGGASKAERKIMEMVAKHMVRNVATKSAVIRGQKVEYFTGAKAVDCLMNSKWTTEPKSSDSEEPYFLNRTFAVEYCNKLLREDFFVRAEKVDLKHIETSGEATSSGGSVASGGKDSKATLRKRGEKASDSPRPKNQGEEGGGGGAEKKTKRKFKLDLHRQQVFFDSKEEVYFWKYDPPSYTSYMVGLAVVVGAIAMTLQPLWPDSSREALWYLSVCVFFIMGVLVALIVARWAIYGVILVGTGGKLKFWILPNLDNEKTGFFDSFKPLHSSEWAKEKKKSKKKNLEAVASEERSSVAEAEKNGEEEPEGEENGGGQNQTENESNLMLKASH